jgi:hypothetical protein
MSQESRDPFRRGPERADATHDARNTRSAPVGPPRGRSRVMARGQPANPLVSDPLPFSLASNSVLVLPIGAALGGVQRFSEFLAAKRP